MRYCHNISNLVKSSLAIFFCIALSLSPVLAYAEDLPVDGSFESSVVPVTPIPSEPSGEPNVVEEIVYEEAEDADQFNLTPRSNDHNCATAEDYFFDAGDGNADWPFEIHSAKDLAMLSCFVYFDNPKYAAEDVYYDIYNDIDLSEYSAPYKVGSGAEPEQSWSEIFGDSLNVEEIGALTGAASDTDIYGGWIPIGGDPSKGRDKAQSDGANYGAEKEHSFSGHINGNGHKITNLNISLKQYEDDLEPDGSSMPVWDVSDYGLFGSAGEINVNNLIIEDSTITTCHTAGAIVGYADKANITNVSVEPSVKINTVAHAGGIVGLAQELKMRNSYNRGEINGNDNVGGLAGVAYDSNITNSFNTGKITGQDTIAGLVGATPNAEVRNSFNLGEITGYASVGGLVGYVSGDLKIAKAYNRGAVTGKARVGGIVAQVNRQTQIENTYNTGQIIATEADALHWNVAVAPPGTGGIIGIAYGDLLMINSLSLSDNITGWGPNIGRMYGFANNSKALLINNYAYKDMTIDTLGGSTLTEVIGAEGIDKQTTSGKNGLGLSAEKILEGSSDFFSDIKTWEVPRYVNVEPLSSMGISPRAFEITGWEDNLMWYRQKEWLPVFRTYSEPTTDRRRPIAFSGTNADLIGLQDGNWKCVFSCGIVPPGASTGANAGQNNGTSSNASAGASSSTSQTIPTVIKKTVIKKSSNSLAKTGVDISRYMVLFLSLVLFSCYGLRRAGILNKVQLDVVKSRTTRCLTALGGCKQRENDYHKPKMWIEFK